MKVKLFSMLALAVVLLCSCNKTDYVNVVPADASFVASINIKDVSEKGDFKNSSAVAMLNDYMGLVVSPKDVKKAQEYISDPSAMGIDFTAPVYVFKTSSDCFGLTMKVSSDDDLSDFIQLLAKQGICSKPVERDDFFSGNLFDDIEYTYDGKTLLLISCLGDGGSAMNKQVSAQLLKQDQDNSFVSTEAFDKMEEQTGDVKMYSNLGIMPQSFAEQVASFLPKGVKKNDIEVLASISFENGKAVLASTIWGKTPKAQQLIDDTDKNMMPLKGSFANVPAEDFLAWASVGVKGEWLLSKIKDEEQLNQLLFMIERGIDVEQMLRTVDGDFTLVMPSSLVTSEKDNMDFLAYAQVKNCDFMDDVDYWQQSMKEYGFTMSKTGNADYLLKLDNDNSISWGVNAEKKELYFATSEAFNSNNASSKSKILNNYMDEIKKNHVFVYINLEQMPMQEIAMMSGVPVIGKALEGLKCMIVKSPSADKMEIVIEMKNKDENFLKQLL